MAMSPRLEPVQGDPNDPHTLLKAVFHYYCRFGRTGAKGRSEKTLGTLPHAPQKHSESTTVALTHYCNCR